MTINYIVLARENREKALTGLKQNRRQALSLSDYAVHSKTTHRVPIAVFISSRNSGLFAQANLR